MSEKIRYTLWIDKEIMEKLNITCVLQDEKKNVLIEKLVKNYLAEKNVIIEKKE